MKRLRERRNKEGVSPIIASILMVAITVVLAAVLYVMISNMTTQASPNLIAGGWQKPVIDSNTDVTLKFGVFTDEVSWIETKIIIDNMDTNETWVVQFQNSTGQHPQLTVQTDSNITLTVTATDLGQNQIIGQGDSLRLQWNNYDAGRYKLTIVYLTTGDAIEMSGSDALFTV